MNSYSATWARLPAVILPVVVAAMLGLVVRLGAATVEEVALSKAANRQRILEAGARKEGKLLWYTTLIVNQALKPLKEAFEKKYPFVQVDYHRADSEALAQRMLAEYQAKRFDVDVLDGTSTIVMLKKAGYMQHYTSPQLRDYPARLKNSPHPPRRDVVYRFSARQGRTEDSSRGGLSSSPS